MGAVPFETNPFRQAMQDSLEKTDLGNQLGRVALSSLADAWDRSHTDQQSGDVREGEDIVSDSIPEHDAVTDLLAERHPNESEYEVISTWMTRFHAIPT